MEALSTASKFLEIDASAAGRSQRTSQMTWIANDRPQIAKRSKEGGAWDAVEPGDVTGIEWPNVVGHR